MCFVVSFRTKIRLRNSSIPLTPKSLFDALREDPRDTIRHTDSVDRRDNDRANINPNHRNHHLSNTSSSHEKPTCPQDWGTQSIRGSAFNRQQRPVQHKKPHSNVESFVPDPPRKRFHRTDVRFEGPTKSKLFWRRSQPPDKSPPLIKSVCLSLIFSFVLRMISDSLYFCLVSG